MSASETTTTGHYWLPVPIPGGTGCERHAYPGRRWHGEPHAEAACGAVTAMARPSEMDWVTAPSCPGCHQALLASE